MVCIFAAFGLNTEITPQFSVFSQMRENVNQKTPNTDSFHAVFIILKLCLRMLTLMKITKLKITKLQICASCDLLKVEIGN